MKWERVSDWPIIEDIVFITGHYSLREALFLDIHGKCHMYTTKNPTPQLVYLRKRVVSIDIGPENSVYVTADGEAYVFGALIEKRKKRKVVNRSFTISRKIEERLKEPPQLVELEQVLFARTDDISNMYFFCE